MSGRESIAGRRTHSIRQKSKMLCILCHYEDCLYENEQRHDGGKVVEEPGGEPLKCLVGGPRRADFLSDDGVWFKERTGSCETMRGRDEER